MDKLKAVLRVAVLIFIWSTSFFAQAQGGPDDGPGGGPEVPTEVPIDGGAVLLLAAGAGYGVKRLRDRKKKKSLPH